MFRTDSHNNPTAFTTDVAAEAHLTEGKDYTKGDPFKVDYSNGAFTGQMILYTARLIGDPIAITIRVIDHLSFMTLHNVPVSRWGYITIPKLTWDSLTAPQKRDVIGWMYQREGGTEMRHLFPHYGKP